MSMQWKCDPRINCRANYELCMLFSRNSSRLLLHVGDPPQRPSQSGGFTDRHTLTLPVWLPASSSSELVAQEASVCTMQCEQYQCHSKHFLNLLFNRWCCPQHSSFDHSKPFSICYSYQGIFGILHSIIHCNIVESWWFFDRHMDGAT